MDVRGPVMSNSVWFRMDDLAIRISEVVSVTHLDSKEPFPYRVRFKSGDKMQVNKEVGVALLQALDT